MVRASGGFVGRVGLVGVGDGGEEGGEGSVVLVVYGGFDDGLDLVVAGDDGWV